MSIMRHALDGETHRPWSEALTRPGVASRSVVYTHTPEIATALAIGEVEEPGKRVVRIAGCSGTNCILPAEFRQLRKMLDHGFRQTLNFVGSVSRAEWWDITILTYSCRGRRLTKA